jgi:acylphosphatase
MSPISRSGTSKAATTRLPSPRAPAMTFSMSGIERIVRVRVSGRVQGVGFRAFVQRRAEARGIYGWVRNRSNGEVEAVFAGSEEAVALLCQACRQGPPQARVERLDILEADSAALAEMGAVFLQLATE